ncbi:MAG TPA: c-type cytochrome [Casimicrobiaceae bacterium]|jgi:cytochrome c553|nr:c-type cytochrome [Casimicrobiaceae bacterium]
MLRTLLLAALLSGPAIALAQSTPPADAPKANAAEAAKPAAPAADATKIVTGVCAACHGADGRGTAPTNPNLAAMPADYITLQLAHFKAGVRQNPIMQGFAATLSDADMVALGAYYAKQKPVLAKAKDPALVKAGQKIYRGGIASADVPACAACHSADGAGIAKNYPRLAAQSSEYTYAQLKAFHDGARGNDQAGKDVNGRIMHTIAARLSDAEMKSVAEYVQGLR